MSKFDDSIEVMQVLRDTGAALNLSGERFSAFREIAVNVT